MNMISAESSQIALAVGMKTTTPMIPQPDMASSNYAFVYFECAHSNGENYILCL